MHKTFREIIDLWGTYAALAHDVGEKYVTVQQWHFRDRIPARVWPKVVEAAKAKGHSSVTLEALATLNADYAARSAA